MLIDARTLPADQTIETEVCIVGTGPAGTTLAREFAGQDFRVCLLESGQIERDPPTQSLYAGELVGDPYDAPSETRRRRLGGTAHAWCIRIGGGRIGVRHMPLDDIDFESRDWLPYSGWPFAKAELEPFYRRAQAICQAGPYAYEADAWEDAQTPHLPLVSNRVTTSMFQFGPSSAFLDLHQGELQQAENITTYLHANVVELETDETAGTVSRVRVACLQGNRFWVRAKIVILATGGIENARLLLLSNQTQQAGLGNQQDRVGRFFMDHPLIRTGKLIPANRQLFNSTALYDRRQRNGVSVMGKLALSEDTLRREQLLNVSMVLFPRHRRYGSTAVSSLKTLVASGLRKQWPEHGVAHLGQVLAGLDDIAILGYRALTKQPYFYSDWARGGWSELPHKEREFAYFEVFNQTEQSPDPDNRVTLGTELDALGCPKLKLHWRWSHSDVQRICRAQEIFAQEIARAGLGQLQIERNGELPQIVSASTHHHLGTTRMHPDPRQGVVDANCQVHGVANLFVAGSSVFPNGGYANPTLTIVALATRLADHVKVLMAHRKVTVAQG